MPIELPSETRSAIEHAANDRGLDLRITQDSVVIHLDGQASEFTMDVVLEQFADGDVRTTLPSYFANLYAAMVEAMFELYPDATNYLETKLTDRNDAGHQWIVIAARSRGQTPGELRQVAERRAEAAEAKVAALEAELAELRAARQ